MMGAKGRPGVDLTGKRFGHLVVLGQGGRSANRRVLWSCLCDCGNYSSVPTHNLNGGNTASCGCVRRCDLQFIEAARSLWREGLTASEIGSRLGVTKGVIIGIAHRNRFPARPSPIKTKGQSNDNQSVGQRAAGASRLFIGR
jgi:hypothetical protein